MSCVNDRELEFLRTLRKDGILNIGLFQFVRGDIIIKNKHNNKFKYKLALNLCENKITKETFIEETINQNEYYLFKMYELCVNEDSCKIVQLRSELKAIQLALLMFNGVNKLVNELIML